MPADRDEPHVHGAHCNHGPAPKPEPVTRVERPGRNDPCWCGSEKKYKKCHFSADEAANK
jgi:uncharacterized protein YecA (UPF0149 family)